MTASCGASSLCRFAFHDRREALRNRGSTVTGERPIGPLVLTASSMEIEPVAVNGMANGGLPAVSLTTVVLGWSTATPYEARTTGRPFADRVQATPRRGSTFALFCW